MKDIRTRKNSRVGFRVRIQPSSQRNELLGWDAAGELRFKIAAPPRGGQANEELIAFLSKILDLPKTSIIVESGALSRNKLLSIPDSFASSLSSLPEMENRPEQGR